MSPAGEDQTSLEALAHDFAEQITATVTKVVPTCHAFRARALQNHNLERFVVRQEPDTGIPLCVGGAPLLTLTVNYQCTWDTPGHFLAVEKSDFKVWPGSEAKGEPLFRYEYLRNTPADLPGAHLHVHAHRDALTHVMSRAGTGSKRGKRRAEAGADDYPRMSELHFAVGGSRYRPCLEDLMEILVRELGVDCPPGGLSALAEGRETWRRQQLRAAVRDSPDDAATVLQNLGYGVTQPERAPVVNRTRLREL